MPGRTQPHPTEQAHPGAPASVGSGVEHWIFDAYNVLHAVLLGRDREVAWWQREHRERVVLWVAELYHRTALRGHRVTLVFDGDAPLVDEACKGPDFVSVVYAPSADDWIVEACARETQTPVFVVSADRSLCDRARARGAHPVRPWAFDPVPAPPE